MSVPLAQDSCGSLYWQEQAQRACVEGLKSVVPIEGCCSLILGINDYRQHCRFRPKRPQDRVEQQSPAELLSPEALVHRQPADENRQENRIARKAAGLAVPPSEVSTKQLNTRRRMSWPACRAR